MSDPARLLAEPNERLRRERETQQAVIADLIALENRVASAITAAKRGHLVRAKAFLRNGQEFFEKAWRALPDN